MQLKVVIFAKYFPCWSASRQGPGIQGGLGGRLTVGSFELLMV